MLVRFRRHPTGIVADIEKAFHQIVVDPSDRAMLRFLYIKNNGENSPKVSQYRFCRLLFGLTPNLAILNGVIQHHLTWYLLKKPNIVRFLAESFFVNDFVSEALTAEEGLSVYQKAKEIMKHGGFNLQKWKTNLPHVQ